MPIKDREEYLAYQRQYAATHKAEAKKRGRKFYKNNAELTKKRATKSRLARDRLIADYKKAHPCSCGEGRPWCLDFHHRDPATKTFTISVNRRVSKKALLEEIAKCVVLCANCHRDLHHSERTGKS